MLQTKQETFTFNNCFPKIVPLYEMWKKYGRVEQATDDNVTRRMRIACWITKTTNIHSELNVFLTVHHELTVH